jgi:DNA-directed RNA polymerase subunit RPC12/RpoP
MTLNFDSSNIELTCPQCAHKFKQRIGRLKNDQDIPCPGCGKPIRIEAKGLRDALKAADISLADFKRMSGKLFK